MKANRLQKIYSISDLKSAVNQWKQKGERIVFTNGCFDLLHRGHVTYLEAAAELGDRLIIGLNSDDSVRRLKGSSRPIQDQDARAEILGALACVDAVCLFKEDTPLNLITELIPDVLVKGGDYVAEQIVGYDVVTQNGGKVFTIPVVEGYSTTAIELRLKDQEKH